MSKNVVFVSNAVIDISIPITSFPICSGQHQSTVDHVVITPGGNATTLFCGARLGLQMQALGNLGDDQMGLLWRSSLAEEGVDVSQVKIILHQLRLFRQLQMDNMYFLEHLKARIVGHQSFLGSGQKS